VIRFAELHASSRTSGVPDEDAPVPLPSLGRLPPLEQDDFDVPILDRPSALALDDGDAEQPALHERDAVEGPSVEELIDDVDAEPSALDDGEAFGDRFDGAIDEAPDAGAVGDDDDGLGNDAADLDESLLAGERADDGADGVDTDSFEVDDPSSSLDRDHERDDEAPEPIDLPPLPELDR